MSSAGNSIVRWACPITAAVSFPGLAALARGANLLEVHVTFHRRMFGPDVAASVTFDELKLLCQMRDALKHDGLSSRGQGCYG